MLNGEARQHLCTHSKDKARHGRHLRRSRAWQVPDLDGPRAWAALASHAVCTLVLQSGGPVQTRTECEAAGRQKRLTPFLIDAQLRVLPAQAELFGHEPLHRDSGLGSPS